MKKHFSVFAVLESSLIRVRSWCAGENSLQSNKQLNLISLIDIQNYCKSGIFKFETHINGFLLRFNSPPDPNTRISSLNAMIGFPARAPSEAPKRGTGYVALHRLIGRHWGANRTARITT
ncbi:hypothetical protein [Paraburkholderia sp. ZP32-5]|uniref:hypothetical protein n=1 Tax=Paraburkholderia sp. ZP32-5 TaxID=2883245 RepID=UPI001F211873|nr:hypothetical protein [Paraburkholderia sp. ZP32-5]